MKKLLVLLFSILISLNSFGEWTKFSDSTNGDKFFIDIDSIKEHNGSVFFWKLRDYIKPDVTGDLSVSMYSEGDCGMFRERTLSFIFYARSMGKGNGNQMAPDGNSVDWRYPAPGSIYHGVLNFVCDYVK